MKMNWGKREEIWSDFGEIRSSNGEKWRLKAEWMWSL